MAVLHVAEHGSERPVRVSEVARALGIPQNYLSKIMHELVREGVLVSTRGKHGGFRLAVPAGRLSLVSVVGRFDAIAQGRTCLLGRPQCSDRAACQVHWRWKAVSEQLEAFFSETTVADLLGGTGIAA